MNGRTRRLAQSISRGKGKVLREPFVAPGGLLRVRGVAAARRAMVLAGLSRKPLRIARRFRLERPAIPRRLIARPLSRRHLIVRHCPPNATPRIACETTETADPAQMSADERR